MARPGTGTRAIMFAWECRASTQGVDKKEVGGYKRDGAVGAGGYPSSEGSRIFSLGKAISQCLAMVRRFQSSGIDAEGEVYFKIFGQDAVNPVKPLASYSTTLDDEKTVCRLDVPERAFYRAINAANRVSDESIEIEEDDVKQDVGVGQ